MNKKRVIRPQARMNCDGRTVNIDSGARSIVIEEGVKRCELCIRGLDILESIALPASLEEVDFDVHDCPKLRKISIDAANPFYQAEGDRCLLAKGYEGLNRAIDCPKPVSRRERRATRDIVKIALGYIPEGVEQFDTDYLLTYPDEELLIPASVRFLVGDSPFDCPRLIIEGDTDVPVALLRSPNLKEVVVKGRPHFDSSTLFSPYGEVEKRLKFVFLNKHCQYRYEEGALMEGDKVILGSFEEGGRPIIPSSARVIGTYAFAGYAPEEINIPDWIEEIDELAFSSGELTREVHIGAGLRKVGHNPFGAFYRAVKLAVADDNPYIYAKDSCLITKDSQTLVYGFDGGRILEGVKRIAAGSLVCPSLTIELPSSLEYIESDAFPPSVSPCKVTINSRLQAGKWAFGWPVSIVLNPGADVPCDFFKSCFRLISPKDVFLSLGNRNLHVKDGRLFNNDGAEIPFFASETCPE